MTHYISVKHNKFYLVSWHKNESSEIASRWDLNVTHFPSPAAKRTNRQTNEEKKKIKHLLVQKLI